MGFTTLLYHRVHPKFGVKPEIFEEQIKFLKKYFQILKLEELEKRNHFPSALITFDDGFLDTFFYAYPVLRKYNVPAILFVSPQRILNTEDVRDNPMISDVSTFEAFKNSFLNNDNSAFLSWGELKAISDLIDVQSHALSHRASLGKGKPIKSKHDWRVYSLNDNEREKIKEGTELTSILVTNHKVAEKELMESKRLLEEKLNKAVNAIAWPWGIYDERVVDIAKKIGYRFCFTTNRGFNRKDFCHIKRLAVNERKSMLWFITRTFLYSL